MQYMQPYVENLMKTYAGQHLPLLEHTVAMLYKPSQL